jgi:hypothetical protein
MTHASPIDASKEPAMQKRWIWLLPWIVVLMVGGCGIGESGQPLTFTTIAQDSVMGSYRDVAAPEIFVIATAQEAQDIAREVLEADPQFQDQRQRMAEQLTQTDFERSFAILVTPGTAIPSVHSITVQQIVRQGDEVSVQAQSESWKPGESRPAVATDPVHIVAVVKTDTWNRQIQFKFVVDGTLAVEMAHFIP